MLRAVLAIIAEAARGPIEWIKDSPLISPAERDAVERYFAEVGGARIYVDG